MWKIARRGKKLRKPTQKCGSLRAMAKIVNLQQKVKIAARKITIICKN